MFHKIHWWRHLVLAFLLWEILIMDSISLLVISLFIFSIYSWFCLCGWYVSKNFFISSGFPVCWHIVVLVLILDSLGSGWERTINSDYNSSYICVAGFRNKISIVLNDALWLLSHQKFNKWTFNNTGNLDTYEGWNNFLSWCTTVISYIGMKLWIWINPILCC